MKLDWYPVKEFVAGDILTFTDFNHYLRNNLLWLKINTLRASQYQDTTPTNNAVTNQRCELGHTNIVFPNNQVATTLAVTFDTAFSSTAIRIVGNMNSIDVAAPAYSFPIFTSVTTTGMNIQCYDASESAINDTIEHSWIAINN